MQMYFAKTLHSCHDGSYEVTAQRFHLDSKIVSMELFVD